MSENLPSSFVSFVPSWFDGHVSSPNVPARIRAIAMPPFDPLNLRAAELRAQGHDVISLGQALPFFGPPAAALDAARAAVDDPSTHVYSTDQGLPSLREALSAKLGEQPGIACTPEEIVITSGGNHAFTLALTTLVDPGDEVVLPSPYFTNHQMAIAALGAIPVEAPVADRETYAITWADLETRVTPKTTAVVLCNPSNPTGAVLDAVEGRRIVSELAARGITLVSDETYMHFVYDRPHRSAASEPAWRRNVVIVGTFSKCFGMMGWRVGFMIAAAATCAEAVKVQDAMIICAPVISQIAAEAAVRDSWDYPSTFHRDLLQRRHALMEGIAGIGGRRVARSRAERDVPRIGVDTIAGAGSGGFFVFLRVPECTDSVALSNRLLEQAHVVTIPGAAFGAAGEGHLRLSYGAATPDAISEATRRLASVLR